MRNALTLAAIAVLVPVTLHAQPMIQSQEGIALENQILQLQQQVQQLQASNGGGSSLGNAQSTPDNSTGATPDSSIVTNLLTQVQQLQTQIQQLNGEVDTLQNQVNTQHDQTEKEIGDLNFKVNGTATPGAPAPGAPTSLTPPAVPTAPQQTAAAPAVPKGTPKEILHDGLAAYAKGDYASAEAAARNILANASTSPQGYRAQYLLAQSLAAENRPQDAAIAYDDAYNRDRQGSEAPQSLLGLANSLADINQNEAACDTLSSLNSQFPTPPAGLGPRIADAEKRAHCS